MTSQSPRIYIYKITFEEVPYYYYGVHKETKFGEYYMGSPVTHKWCWKLYTPKKQILELFEYSDEGWLESQEVEKRIIKPFYNTDKWCLNENVGGKVSLEICRNTGKINGKKIKELGIGVHGRTKEQMTEDGKKGGKISGKKIKELGLGVHGRTKEQMTEDGKKGGKKLKELGLGVHKRTKEQIKKDSRKGGKKGGKKIKELGVGIFELTSKQLSENGKKGGKKSSSQKWKCLETGFITNPGNLTKYQRARGIDTSKRVRIS
jgi:hypothetical protein